MGATERPRRGANGVSRLCLDVTLRNFGPIKKASMSLRPLTIFVGTNNMGKSYAAMLAHSLISARLQLDRPAHTLTPTTQRTKCPAAALVALENTLVGLGPAEEAPCPPGLAYGIVSSSMGRYRELLQNEIMRNFGSNLQDLARSGAGHFSLSLKACNGTTVTYRKDSMVCRPDEKFPIVFKKSRGASAPRFRLVGGKKGALHCTVAAIPRAKIRELAPLIHAGLELAVLRQVLGRIPPRSDYFPAARSGILQAYRTIASNIVRNAPYAGIGGVKIPQLPGVITDFLSSIIDMRESRGAHYDTGRRIESDVLGGHVKLRHSGPDTMPEIIYDHPSHTMPMHRTSSTVSELAPLTLHLKYCAADRGVLIIEEPEAHLHPDSQIVLAGHLVELVRAGIDIIITTHSAPLFEAVSQYYQASLLPPKGRRNALGREDLYLREAEIAPHLFQMDGRGGCVVERIRASATEGIEQEEFIRADRLLNENNMRIGEHSN